MKALIIIVFLLVSTSSLLAQIGWKDMGGYKETMDTTGLISQIKITPDGKYLFCLTNLTELTKKKLYIQKWNIDSGKIVFSHLVDTNFYRTYGINLNCDAATYTMSVVLNSDIKNYRLLVKDIDTDSLLISVIDKSGDANGFAQIDFDSVFKCFYYAHNSTYSTQAGANYIQYSTGSIKKKILSSDSLIEQVIVTPNTYKFNHLLGTSVLVSITNNLFEEYKNLSATTINSNRINYIGFKSDKVAKLAEYNDYTSHNPFPENYLELSQNGKFVVATNQKTYSVWFIDSTMRVSQLYYNPTYNSSFCFINNKYLLANSQNDSSIYTINVGLRKICGSVKVPFSKKISIINSLPDSTLTIAACNDGKLRIFNALVDTLTSTYSFTYNQKSIFQQDAISFCALIPSFESSTIEWDFGDGTTSNSINPQHKYDSAGIFDVRMKVNDNTGEHIVTEQKLIEVKQKPNPITLDFDADVLYGSSPLTVKFTNKPTGTILTYKWDFGDGSTSSARDTIHTFMGQRIYTVTLTVNNGIKDTSLTKLHYIHTDTYPSFLLNTTLVKNFNGEEQNINLLKYKSINMFENIVRTDSGDNYLKMVAFETSKGFVSGTQIDMCNVNYEIYKIQDNGYIGTNEYFHTPQSRCFIRSGVVGILHNSLISFYMYDQIPRFSAYILNEDLNNTIVKYPYFGLYNRVRPLNNTIDCFAFRDVLDFSRNLTILCFYIDTTKLLTKDSIIGYALPAVETSNNTFLSVVSPLTFDSVESRKIQIRRYNSSGIFFDSTVIYRLTFDFIYDIIRIPNNRYMLCGTTNISSKEVYGLILIMDENGTVEYSKSVPQWKKLKRITRMDDNTYAITGTPYVGYPGFIAVKSDGKIVGDFRANFTRTTSNTPDNYDVTVCNDCVDVSFGKTMKTVFFTRNNGYDAELYISDNPYLKDINVSVKEEQQMELPQSNSLVLAPNPTDGITTMQYLSTTQQKITITISTVLGELYYNEEIEVAAGKNDIQLDMSRFGSGVAFIGVSDKTSVLHGQIHVFR